MKDIALVGHGMSMIGQDLGGYIDSHLDVLRFAKDPDDAIVAMDPEDFGERTDILMFTETGRKRLHLDPRFESEEVRPWSYDKKTGPDKDYLTAYQNIKRKDRAIHLSRGTAAVIMACKKGYDEITIFGFDNIVNRDNTHYLSCFRDLKLTRKYHDYDAERDIINLVCDNFKVRLECFPETL